MSGKKATTGRLGAPKRRREPTRQVPIPASSRPPTETAPAPPGGWTCFHCGATFHKRTLAAAHFGVDKATPAVCLRGAEALDLLRGVVELFEEAGAGEAFREALDLSRAFLDDRPTPVDEQLTPAEIFALQRPVTSRRANQQTIEERAAFLAREIMGDVQTKEADLAAAIENEIVRFAGGRFL